MAREKIMVIKKKNPNKIGKKYNDFCKSEGEKIILTKSEFKKVVKSAGYTVDNSSRHNNSVCVFNVTCN